ncbi:Secreted protein antigen [Mycobacteroides abscessus subsp. bolletii]|uniref:hypothetical protein n=1 Tax=Mycobacteroides abscessus TaxID=36809 RepID=UPI000929E448|nr:hypothetical protein [Mycobacteroides abscessus]SIH92592.1 Secreted protein antigen [Mycobacteroides abscessus subsp. bolletii]SLE08958.1 Secreted protein antigen [Mycobacteroides abscessus subsp. bolletii]SLE93305.1 Secreted protein antigen [Mycobacteroides abscessus subsp. bolletii]
MRISLRKALTAPLLALGIGVAGLTMPLATAQATPNPQIGPAPAWCPGDYWDPVWGNNWDVHGCHDSYRAGYGDGLGGVDGFGGYDGFGGIDGAGGYDGYGGWAGGF